MIWVEEDISNIDLHIQVDTQSKLEEIIKKTRAKGMTVEYYLQKYGHFDKYDGKRYLNRQELEEALTDLDIAWVIHQKAFFDKLFDTIDKACHRDIQRGKIYLQDFGNILANPNNTTIDLTNDEAIALVQIHKVLS